MRNVNSIWQLAWGLMITFLALSLAAAFTLQDAGLLSLKPPVTWDVPQPVADVVAGDTLSLYASAFSAWVVLILLLPVYVFVWSAGNSERDCTVWLAFWTSSYVAYLVHLVISMFWFFGGDFSAMANSSRVSVFWPGMAIVLFWGADIWLALRGVKSVWIFRAIVHLLVIVLFIGESAIKGEQTSVKMLGMALLAAMITGMTLWLRDKTKKVSQ